MELEQLLHQGLAAQQRDDQAEAERCYLGVLAMAPNDPNANHLLGVLRYQQGRSAEALALIGKALAVVPQSPESHAYYGATLHSAGRHEEALASLDRSLTLAPAQPEVLNVRGMVLMALNRPEEALLSLDQAVALAPAYIEAWNNRGIALRNMARAEESRASFARAAALDPDNPHINFNLGLACLIAGKLGEAAQALETSLKVVPNDRAVLNNLAVVLCESGRTAEAMTVFNRHAALGGESTAPEPDHKRKHDQEQKAYLAQNGISADVGARLSGPAVNPDNDIAAIAERWRTASPQVAVIDNVLTPAGLEAIRRYCWQSPVWKKTYDEGYLGALPEEGFAAPLLAQIADELRQTYGAIFETHKLRYLWAFKCDSQLKGVNIHADFAAVNVNFWITPDEANLNPDSGGLIIWDKAAPLDWDFNTYNNNEAAIRSFLAESGAKSQTVPYRANRAVIFDSDLFHQTDDISFREGYTNRRINVTMLYGRRRLHEGTLINELVPAVWKEPQRS
ncbi:MAG: tetratricopeptide repeat protein [Alphaproteobacteria bacterium]